MNIWYKWSLFIWFDEIYSIRLYVLRSHSDIQLMIIHKVCLFYKPYDKNIIKVGSSKMMATLKWATLDNNCQSKNQVVFSMTTFGYPTTIYVSL